MKFTDLLAIAFMNLWRRKMRAILTVLGMVIGTAAIVLMISLGIGINEATIEMYSQWGNLTVIDVMNYRYQDPEQQEKGVVMMMGSNGEMKLDAKAVGSFKKISGVSAVMPSVEVSGLLKSGQYYAYAYILGVDVEEAEAFGFTLSEGSLPAAHSGNNYEIVLSSYILQEFRHVRTQRTAMDSMGNSKIVLGKSRFQFTFDHSNIFPDRYMDYDYDMGGGARQQGKIYKINPTGVMSQEGNNSSYMCLMDINALKRLFRENKDYMYGFNADSYNRVQVKCEDMETVPAVTKAINQMGYQTYSMNDALQMANKQTEQLRLLLSAVGGVSLLVAAIGIMNTMMMSIYERTREIGIIKVLGCRMGNIARMFLVEAAIIGLIGGAIGLGASYGISHVMNTQFMGDGQMRSVIPIWLSAGAVAFSMVVALISGMYPAVRAMRLSALSAIRSE